MVEVDIDTCLICCGGCFSKFDYSSNKYHALYEGENKLLRDDCDTIIIKLVWFFWKISIIYFIHLMHQLRDIGNLNACCVVCRVIVNVVLFYFILVGVPNFSTFIFLFNKWCLIFFHLTIFILLEGIFSANTKKLNGIVVSLSFILIGFGSIYRCLCWLACLHISAFWSNFWYGCILLICDTYR